MRPGRVVYIRVNPRDCIACVELMDKLKIDTSQMSFDTVIRTALSSLLATVQDAGLLPRSDGFDFNEKVGTRFPNSRQGQGQRLQFTLNLDKEMQLREAYDMSPKSAPTIKPPPKPETVDQQRARTLLAQIVWQFDNSDNPDPEAPKLIGWLNDVIEGISTMRDYQLLTGEITK